MSARGGHPTAGPFQTAALSGALKVDAEAVAEQLATDGITVSTPQLSGDSSARLVVIIDGTPYKLYMQEVK